MRKLLIAAALLAGLSGAAEAQYGYPSNSRSNSYGSVYGTGSNPNSHYVNPYTRSDGTSVQGHQRTNPNNSLSDNYGAKGNYNPNSSGFGSYGGRGF